MSDVLENKAVEILDKSQAAIGQFADKLGEMAKQYGPDVANGALSMARVDAAQGLVYGLVFAVAAIPCIYFCRPLAAAAKAANAHYWKPSTPSNDPSCIASFNFGVLAWLSGIGAVVCVVGAIVQLSDIWRWVGIFEPKLWLAKRILGL